MKCDGQSIGGAGSVLVTRLRISVRVGFAGSNVLRDVTDIRFEDVICTIQRITYDGTCVSL